MRNVARYNFVPRHVFGPQRLMAELWVDGLNALFIERRLAAPTQKTAHIPSENDRTAAAWIVPDALNVSRAEKIADVCGVSVKWLMSGDERSKNYPCNSEMIEYLDGNEEVRRYVWRKMNSIPL